jgi:hypothetical protein
MTMVFALARNMSMMSRHHATVRPVEIRPAAVGRKVPGIVEADLGPEARRKRTPEALAAWLLDRLGEPQSNTPIEALRTHIEREVAARGLTGCAVVMPANAHADIAAIAQGVVASERTRPMTDLALTLVLLSKSSEVVWVARKTPVLDRDTLCRRLVTRDVRFVAGGQR